MSWRQLVLAAAVVAGGAGCGTGQTAVAGGQVAVSPAATAASVSRLQKADRETPATGSLLDGEVKPAGATVEGRVGARIRASVNGAAILDDEVRDAAAPLLYETLSLSEPERSAKQKEILDKVINRLVERELILQEAFTLLGKKEQFLAKIKGAAAKEFDKSVRAMKKRYNLKNDEELKAALQSQGLSLAGIRRQVEREFIATTYMQNRIFTSLDRVTPEQILTYYQQHPSEFEVPDSVKWQDIFIDAGRFPDRAVARQFAEDVAAKARAGEDFQKLALKYDNGDSSYRNGEGLGQRRGEIKPPEAEPVLFNLKDGQVGPLVELGNGYHVVRLVKREYAGQMPFDEKTQTAIKNKLTAQIWEREYKRIVAELRRKATVEIATISP
jgi:parvulin-like peptidyl-prolyl isomerase